MESLLSIYVMILFDRCNKWKSHSTNPTHQFPVDGLEEGMRGDVIEASLGMASQPV